MAFKHDLMLIINYYVFNESKCFSNTLCSYSLQAWHWHSVSKVNLRGEVKTELLHHAERQTQNI